MISAPQQPPSSGGLVHRAIQSMERLESHIAESWLSGWSPANIQDLQGKRVLVTGGSSGIGLEVCRKLAMNGAEVFMVTRVLKSGEEAASRIRAEVGKAARVHVLQCDMSRLSNVTRLAREYRRQEGKLDVLVNNAGVFYPGPFATTDDGIEQTLGINYYAHALLTLELLGPLRATPHSRVVFMASGLMPLGRINFTNLTGAKYHDSGLVPYSSSKLFLSLFAAELSRRMPQLDVVCVHPGLVASPMHAKSDASYPTNIIFKIGAALIGSDARKGAWSTLFAATSPTLTGKGLRFVGPSLLPLNLWPTSERPWFLSGRVADPEAGWLLFEATQDVLKEKLGSDAPSHLGLVGAKAPAAATGYSAAAAARPAGTPSAVPA